MHPRTLVLSALTLSALATTVFAQASSSTGCNDMNRQLALTAGVHNHVATPCVPIQISGGVLVGSGTLTTPSQCTLGYMEASQNIYSCVGSLEGVNCNPFGWKATVTVFTGGGCPTPPDFFAFSPSSLSGWSSLPGTVMRSLVCAAPEKSASEEPSAKISGCPGGGDPGQSSLDGQVIVAADGTAGTLRDTLTAATTVGPQGSFNPFLSEYDLAQTAAVEELPGLLSILAAQQQGPSAVEVRATVRFEHFDAGAVEPRHVYVERIRGDLGVDGRFDVLRDFLGTSQGEPVSIVHQSTFDGERLRDLPLRGEFGNVIALGPDTPRAIHDVYLLALQPVHRWLYDPFELPMFASGVTTVESGDAASAYVVQRVYPLVTGGTFVGEALTIVVRNGVMLPTERVEHNVNGSVRARWEYADFIQVGAVWRPSLVTLTDYLDSHLAGRRIVITTQIEAAQAMAEVDEQLMPLPFTTEQFWQVWD